MYLSQREYRPALEAYEEARGRYPHSGDPLAGMGRIEIIRGDLERAVLYHRMAAALSDDLPGPTLALGNLYLRLNRLDEAAHVFSNLLAAHPDFSPARRNLAAVHAKQGRTTSALEQYEEVLRVEPGHAATQVNIGRLLLSLGRLEAAAGHLEAVRGSRPDDPSLLHDLGRVYARRGDLEQARDLFEQTIAADSTFAGSYFQIGLLEFQSGELAQAEHYFKAALMRNPGMAEPYRFLAQTYLRQGRKSAGEAGLQQYQRVKKVEDEIERYEQRLRDDPLDAQASFGLGFHYARLNLLSRARMYYQHTLNIYPEHAPAWNNMGNLLLRLGQVDAAATAYRNSIASDTTYAEARTNLARLQRARGDTSVTVQDLLRAMATEGPQATSTEPTGR
jgi:tetratricopeptide (TPR) repeat protein